MFRKTLLYRVMAALLTLALLLPAFTVAAVPAEPEDEEPVYDMMGCAVHGEVFEWYRFNSEDPTQFEAVGSYQKDISAGTEYSGIEEVNGQIYASERYMQQSIRGLYMVNSDFSGDVRYTDLWVENIDCSPVEVSSENLYELCCWSMSYSEEEQICYAFANASYILDIDCGRVFGAYGIAELDLETGGLSFICTPWWWIQEWGGGDGPILEFWPSSVTYEGNGKFLIIEAWTNKLFEMDINGNPNDFSDIDTYRTVVELPRLATLFPLFGAPEQYMPQSMQYFEEDNTVLWSCCNAMDAITALTKIDVDTGEIIYDVSLHDPGMPLEPPEGQNEWNYLWPMHFYRIPGISPGLMGDVDGSGEVDATDALLIMRYAMGIISELDHPDKADVDGSGAVEMTDALLALRMAMGII